MFKKFISGLGNFTTSDVKDFCAALFLVPPFLFLVYIVAYIIVLTPTILAVLCGCWIIFVIIGFFTYVYGLGETPDV